MHGYAILKGDLTILPRRANLTMPPEFHADTARRPTPPTRAGARAQLW
jgi:hypothetical protein